MLVDGSVAQQYQATNDDLVALSFDELGTSADVCVAVAKGDPKGLLPEINEAIAKMKEENTRDMDGLSSTISTTVISRYVSIYCEHTVNHM